MSIIFFPFLCMMIMGWSSVFESSNIRGLQDIEMRQPKPFNADFAVKMSEFRVCWLKEANRQSAGLSDAVLNEGNAAEEDPGDLPLFQMSVAHFKHLSKSGHLCKPKVNKNQKQRFELPIKWCINAKLNRHKVVSRCSEIWGRLAWQEGADWQSGQRLSFSQISRKNRKVSYRPCKRLF